MVLLPCRSRPRSPRIIACGTEFRGESDPKALSGYSDEPLVSVVSEANPQPVHLWCRPEQPGWCSAPAIPM
eukprot:6939735-Lingulodinium_polyedra.AAC.1